MAAHDAVAWAGPVVQFSLNVIRQGSLADITTRCRIARSQHGAGKMDYGGPGAARSL